MLGLSCFDLLSPTSFYSTLQGVQDTGVSGTESDVRLPFMKVLSTCPHP